MNPANKRVHQSPQRSVWLLATIGFLTGVSMIGVVSWSLFQIRSNRIVSEAIHAEASSAFSSADETLNKSLSLSSNLLSGSSTNFEYQESPWEPPFASSASLPASSDFSFAPVLQSSRKLEESLSRIQSLNHECLEYSTNANAIEHKLLASWKALADSIDRMRAHFDSSHGIALLELAIKYRAFRQTPESMKGGIAKRILEGWSPNTLGGELSKEIADLDLLCQKMRAESDLDRLVDFKDNRIQPTIARIRRHFSSESAAETRETVNAMLAQVEVAIFGSGFKYDLEHQSVVLGSGGAYQACQSLLACQLERDELELAIASAVREFHTRRAEMLLAMDEIGRGSGKKAADSISHAWKMMLVFGSIAGVVFGFLATQVSATVKSQFLAIREKSDRLATATKELKASTQKLEQLSLVAKHTKNGVVIANPNLGIEWANQSLLENTGYALDELLGKSPTDLFLGPGTCEIAKRELLAGIESQRHVQVQLKKYRRDGSTYWSKLEVSPVFDQNLWLTNFVGVEADISALVESNAKLEEQTKEVEKLALVAQHTDSAVLITDSNKNVEWVNGGFTRITGFDPSEVVGKNFLSFQRERSLDLDVIEKMATAFELDSSRRFESLHRRKSGEEYWVEIEIKRTRSDHSDCERFFIIKSDVTERVLADQRNAKLQQELLTASRQAGKAEVATGVLHNVGNILNSVNVSTNLLQHRVSSSPVANLEKLSLLIEEHNSNFANFIRDDERGKKLPTFIQRLSKAFCDENSFMKSELHELAANIEHIKEIVSMQQSTAKINGVMQMLDAETLLENALSANKASLKHHHIKVVKELSDDMPSFVSDKHQILQILVNLVKNAKDSVLAADVTDPTISIRVACESESILFSVSDNGLGIDPETIEKIFRHGFTTKRTGHGFGLHSSANAAGQLGGELSAVSAGLGHGATFELRLPRNEFEQASHFRQRTFRQCDGR